MGSKRSGPFVDTDREVACKYCKETGLYWERYRPIPNQDTLFSLGLQPVIKYKWRLVNRKNTPHKCPRRVDR